MTRPSQSAVPIRLVVLAAAILALAACGGGDDGLRVLRTCGNGTVEAGEECDPGGVCSGSGSRCLVGGAGGCAENEICVAADSDLCSSICNVPMCGDGFAQGGREQCDRFDLRGSTCADFGRGADPEGGPAGGLACTNECVLDPAGCGGVFTPTPPASPTPPATATATATNTRSESDPTFTPTATSVPTATSTPPCNLPILEPGERAPDPIGTGFIGDPEGTDCPQDIEVLECTPSSQMFTLMVAYEPPVGTSATSVTSLLSYQSDVVQIPGTGRAREVADRFEELRDPNPFVFTVSDLDFATRVVFVDTGNLPAGVLYQATFDICEGSGTPDASSFACIVEGCAGAGGSLAGCTCSVILP